MRSLITLILAAVCLAYPVYCDRFQSTAVRTPQAQFIENTSAAEIEEIVHYANYLLIGPIVSFDQANELPMLNILNMYCAEQEEKTKDKCERIAISALEDFTVSRFGEGVFDAQALLKADQAGIRLEDGVIYTSGFGNISGYLDGEITIQEVVREGDRVKIAVQITLDEAGRDKAQGELTLKITDKGYQYAAYHFTTRPWTIADLELPMAESIKLEQIDAYFGELRSSQLFEWEGDTVGQKRIYSDGTEVTLYLGKADSPYGVIMGITTSRADLPLIRGVHIGDSWEAVAARFMNGGYEPEAAEGGWRCRLYGVAQHMSTYGMILYDHDQPAAIQLGQEGASVSLDLDDRACVETITVVFE